MSQRIAPAAGARVHGPAHRDGGLAIGHEGPRGLEMTKTLKARAGCAQRRGSDEERTGDGVHTIEAGGHADGLRLRTCGYRFEDGGLVNGLQH